MRAWASRKWLSTKNRSPRRSTTRHPITIASTAKPPDPMPCALAVILLPESRAHGCHMQKTVFPGPAIRAHNGVRTRAVPACGVCSCGVGERRESGQLHGCRGAVHGSVHGLLLSGPDRSRARVWSQCAGGRVGGWSTMCLPAVRGPVCVDAWAGAASSGSFRAVASGAV